MSKVDLSKPVFTKKGHHRVDIVCRDVKDTIGPILGVVRGGQGGGSVMRTVFDLVGHFRVLKKSDASSPGTITRKEIVLHKDLTPSQCAAGRTALESFIKDRELLKPHIKTSGPERCWFHDWELRERKVKEEAA